MAFEMLVGLEVTNDKVYADYRAAMAPLLEERGGGFRFDFKIAEVLKPESESTMNRVFTIFFKDEEAKNAFFSDPKYLEVKNRYFDQSVKKVTLISEYKR